MAYLLPTPIWPRSTVTEALGSVKVVPGSAFTVLVGRRILRVGMALDAV